MALWGSSSRELDKMAAGLAAAGLVMMTALVLTAGGERDVGNYTCPEDDPVYPFSSECFNPAKYHGAELYELMANGAAGMEGLKLAPQWDDANSTCYLRLADAGAAYKIIYLTLHRRPYVTQSDNVVLVNADTNRALAWRPQGHGRYFLVELDTSDLDLSNVTYFQFSATRDGRPLPCLMLETSRCEVYKILTYGTSLGWSPHRDQDGVTYITQASSSDALPFLLLRTASSVRILKSPK